MTTDELDRILVYCKRVADLHPEDAGGWQSVDTQFYLSARTDLPRLARMLKRLLTVIETNDCDWDAEMTSLSNTRELLRQILREEVTR